jgi:anti-sigma B factor antagonist
MDDTISISTEQVSDKCALVVLSGRFDASTANVLKDVFYDVIIGNTTHVIVDMEQVSFIDSSSLAALVSALKMLRRVGGSLLLAGMQPQARMVFSLTMLDQIISIYPSRQAAIDSLKTETIA